MKKDVKVVAIIQARQGSTRLPKKAMMKILEKPLLGYVIERVGYAKLIDEIVVATTVSPEDDVIEALCRKMHVRCFRGSEDDVLSRYFGAARMTQADVIVRITADCPLMDPEVIDKVVGRFLDASPDIDYVSNTLERTYPRGMDVEVISSKCLEIAMAQARAVEEREHVTLYIYRHPEQFSLISVVHSSNQSYFRWTVDTSEDFLLIKKLIESLYPQNSCFTLEDLVVMMELHPDWKNINANIDQKLIE
jgi:spore coat polysaccharide biosynthesis protein SpsF